MGNIKPWEELTIQDDYMFKLVMRRKHICKTMIEKILRIKLADIRYIDEEKTVKPRYESKGVRLDVYVEGSGEIFEIDYSEFRIIPSFSSHGLLSLATDENHRNNFLAVA